MRWLPKPLRRKILIVSFLWLSLVGIALSVEGQSGCKGVKTLAQCPARGCADDPRSAEALLNRAKRKWPSGTRAKKLTFADFRTLQEHADKLVGQKVHLKLEKDERDKLRGLAITNGVVSEGSFVKLVGFIASGPAPPHATSAESVNCRLTGQANSDFHISVVERAGASEFNGIVVEMIPQRRPAGWTIPKLKRIGTKKVLITGSLFYDNEHIVNTRGKPRNQPKRFSLWEIHPVKEFFICLRANNACDESQPTQWTRLVDFLPSK